MSDYEPKYFILGDDNELVSATMLEWTYWFAEAGNRRVVAWTGNEDRFVSTVFLGLDHRGFGDGPPLVFETMAFERLHEVYPDDFLVPGMRGMRKHETLDQERYGSWKAAVAGHKRICDKVFKVKAGMK